MISTVQQRVKSVDYQILQWSTLKLFQYHSHSAKAKATFGNIERAIIALYNYPIFASRNNKLIVTSMFSQRETKMKANKYLWLELFHKLPLSGPSNYNMLLAENG